MPIYEYSCEKCRHVFEEWVRRVDDNVDQVCPVCGAAARRIVSNTSFVLKGGGWYVTDYGYRKGQDEGGKPASGGKTAEAGSGGAAAGPAGGEASASTASGVSDAPAVSSGSGATASAA